MGKKESKDKKKKIKITKFVVKLRGTTVNRTYGIHNNLYI